LTLLLAPLFLSPSSIPIHLNSWDTLGTLLMAHFLFLEGQTRLSTDQSWKPSTLRDRHIGHSLIWVIAFAILSVVDFVVFIYHFFYVLEILGLFELVKGVL
jgi:hypothetical protein